MYLGEFTGCEVYKIKPVCMQTDFPSLDCWPVSKVEWIGEGGNVTKKGLLGKIHLCIATHSVTCSHSCGLKASSLFWCSSPQAASPRSHVWIYPALNFNAEQLPCVQLNLNILLMLNKPL